MLVRREDYASCDIEQIVHYKKRFNFQKPCLVNVKLTDNLLKQTLKWPWCVEMLSSSTLSWTIIVVATC